ncbi:MAG: hypothetical protein BGO67_02825 [Alphaproteobacteria bacterium 41-28]|nr:MAG: hypothetical protein BGO67_02825 [Alphaproteobacteria bacterium 41-28]
MKKIFCTLAAYGALTGTAFSQEKTPSIPTQQPCYPSNVCYFDGFYIGGQVGVSSLKTKERTSNPNETHHFGDTKFAGGGLVGYDLSCQKFKLGAEFVFNGSGTKAKAIHHFNNTKITLKNNYMWGFRALPGYEVTPGTVAHILVGYANGHFKLKDNGTYVITNRKFHKSGFQAGVGLKTLIACNFVLRVDALYTIYGSKSYAAPHTGDLTADRIKNKPSAFEGFVSLIYKF